MHISHIQHGQFLGLHYFIQNHIDLNTISDYNPLISFETKVQIIDSGLTTASMP